ncbi:hypothetical protein DERF_016720 [Dermatophagoides farinae]|uniref:Uncharacterized protein n=1 Tax=Dermatophagoides farinae TaxID=6954 RepID=A0A922HEY6_DERFA|nr:hypothetical protein DERF_016720 [Dermatophagoides farinae]
MINSQLKNEEINKQTKCEKSRKKIPEHEFYRLVNSVKFCKTKLQIREEEMTRELFKNQLKLNLLLKYENNLLALFINSLII